MSKPQKRVKLSSLKADRQKESEGDWIPAVDLDPAISWLVRSPNYAPFKKDRDDRLARLSRRVGDEPISDDEMAKINGELACEHLLLGWKGLTEDDETDIPYDPDKAYEILTDESYRLVRQSIYLAATKVGRSEIEFVGDGAKN